jgi:hypothetical protein
MVGSSVRNTNQPAELVKFPGINSLCIAQQKRSPPGHWLPGTTDTQTFADHGEEKGQSPRNPAVFSHEHGRKLRETPLSDTPNW